MADINSIIIAATTAAVAADLATEINANKGELVTVALNGDIGAELIEIKKVVELNGVRSYVSMADPTDPIDTTRKVLSSAFTERRLEGPIVIAIDKPATAGAVGVHKYPG